MSAPERWIRTNSYGAVWHRMNENGDAPICGTILRSGREPEICEGVPWTKHVSYICLRCYRLERGVPAMIPPVISGAAIGDRLDRVEVTLRAFTRVLDECIGRLDRVERSRNRRRKR